MFFTILLFNDSFVVVISVSFTSLIVIEMLNVLQESTRPDKRIYILIAMSLAIYFASITMAKTLFQMQTFDWAFVWRVLVIVFFCWAPPAVTRWLFTRIDPSAVDKIRREEDERLKQETIKRRKQYEAELKAEAYEKEYQGHDFSDGEDDEIAD